MNRTYSTTFGVLRHTLSLHIAAGVVASFLMLSGSAFAQNFHLNLLAHLPQYARGQTNTLIANDVTGYVAPNGTEYAIVGYFHGTSIISLANPSAPVEVAFAPALNNGGNEWRDIETWGNTAYVGQEQEGTGLNIIDLSPLPTSVNSTWFQPNLTINGTTTQLRSIHSVWVKDGYLYLNGTNIANKGTLIFDVHTTPLAPVFVAAVNDEYVHDCFTRNDTLFTSNIYSGHFRMYDIHNKANPMPIGIPQSTPYLFTHNTWTSDNGEVIFTTDERAGAPVASYDIHDLNNIQELGQFRRYATRNTGVIPHNVYTKTGNFVVLANYTDGVTIIDGSRPNNMVEVGSYDTYPAATVANDPFHGVWACYPYLPSGLLLAADIEEGFFVFQPTYTHAAWLEGNVTDANTGAVLNGVSVALLATPDTIAAVKSVLNGDYKTGYGTAGTYTAVFSKPGYQPFTATVVIQNGIVTVLNVQQMPIPGIPLSGTVRDATTAQTVANAIVHFDSGSGIVYDAMTDANGVYTVPSFITNATYTLDAGKWMYKTREITALNIPTSPYDFTLTSGIEDPFALDLGWTVQSTCTTGAWIRGLPDGVMDNNAYSTPLADVTTDIGKLCYLTDNRGGSAGSYDVDGGYTRLTSPVFSLAGYTNPQLRFNYWFYNNDNGGSLPPDRLLAILTNGIRTDTVLNTTQSQSAWRNAVVNIANYQTPTANMHLEFYTADDGPGNVVEAAIDWVRLMDVVATENLNAPTIPTTAQPNPFQNVCTVHYQLAKDDTTPATLVVVNALGQTVLNRSLPAADGSTLAGQISFGTGLVSGLYYAHIEQGGTTSAVMKLVKM